MMNLSLTAVTLPAVMPRSMSPASASSSNQPVAGSKQSVGLNSVSADTFQPSVRQGNETEKAKQTARVAATELKILAQNVEVARALFSEELNNAQLTEVFDRAGNEAERLRKVIDQATSSNSGS